jgi:pilus assembly protein FimV
MGQTNRKKANAHKLKAISVLVFSAWSLPLLALDLGKLQMLSAIGEPLRAEIEITQASPQELSTLRAQLASPEAFSKAGMEFNPALKGLTATLQTTTGGANVLVLNGQNPVQENFIDLILETQWATGRLVKNYALLLTSVNDQALTANPTVTSRSTAPQAPRLPTLPTPITQTEPPQPVKPTNEASGSIENANIEKNAQGVPVYRFGPVNSNTAAAPTEVNRAMPPLQMPAVSSRIKTPSHPENTQIKVRQGDTASKIALQFMPSQVSMDQMLLAIQKANPDAFIQNNVNLLKAGAVLTMPSVSDANQITREEARRTVLAQNREFAEYANRLARSPLLVGSKNSRKMEGKVTEETVAPDQAASTQDKLTLTQPTVTANSDEARLAAEKEAKDASDQIASLNKNLQDLKALTQGEPGTPSVSPSSTSAVEPPPAVQTATPPKPAPSSGSSHDKVIEISQDKQLWAWAAALLAAMASLIVWMRRKSKNTEDVYAPAYNDDQEQNPTDRPDPKMDKPTSFQSPMSSIDLDLPAQPTRAVNTAHAPFSAPAGASANNDIDQNKLNLATQLLAKGDQDLARALILSVASTASGEVKVRAIQLLGQIR